MSNLCYLPPYEVNEVTPEELVGIPSHLLAVDAPSFWANLGDGYIDGLGGVLGAVVDTGLDVTHQEFKGRIYKTRNYTTGDYGAHDKVSDIVGHGTHVAGTVLGESVGFAKRARIYAAKVFGDPAPGIDPFEEALIMILRHNRTVAEIDKVRVINCSWASTVYQPIIANVIRELRKEGVVVVVSAGNAGDGNPDTLEIFTYPGYIWEVMTTGAVNDAGLSAKFSSSYDGIDLAAPGVDVLSAWPLLGYKKLSGTSMSAPCVTGMLLLICAAFYNREKRFPTPDELEGIGMKHVRKLSLDSRLVGAGMIDLTYDKKKWPLWHVQTGAFYDKPYAEAEGARVVNAMKNTYGLERKVYLPQY